MNKVLQILCLVFAVFFDAIFSAQIAAAFGYVIGSARVLDWCILIFFAILGNYLPNLRPNYLIGIRTPWTLEDPETWRAPHRLGGRMMFFGALLLLALQLFVDASLCRLLLVVLVLLLVVWAFLYSWYYFRTHAGARKTA